MHRMSKQLILSATLSVLAMTGVALLSTPGIAAIHGDSAPLISAKASIDAELLSLGTLLPGIK
jgi:hypothetical protein